MQNTFTQKNARFHTYVNGGWVKLTLKPGQEVSWYTYSRHEEGYHAEEITWSHEGDYIRETMEYSSTDCDGRHGGGRTDVCPISQLSRLPIMKQTWHEEKSRWYEEPTGLFKPAWQQERIHPVFDLYAQQAGY